MKIGELNRRKTAFTSHHVRYRFISMPFALRKATKAFQTTKEVILEAEEWQYALLYLDDITIVCKTSKEHIHYIHKVITLLNNAGLSLQAIKFHVLFFAETVYFL